MKYIVTIGKKRLEAHITGYLKTKMNDKETVIDLVKFASHRYSALINNKLYEFSLSHQSGELVLFYKGFSLPVRFEDEKLALLSVMKNDNQPVPSVLEVKAPMPGKIVDIFVSEGQYVNHGQPLFILEAMKMENEIKSISAGTISEIKFQVGQNVEKNDTILKIGIS